MGVPPPLALRSLSDPLCGDEAVRSLELLFLVRMGLAEQRVEVRGAANRR